MPAPNFTDPDRVRYATLERIMAQHRRVQESYSEMMDNSALRDRTVAVALEEEGITRTQIAQHLGVSSEAISQWNRRGRGALGWLDSQHTP